MPSPEFKAIYQTARTEPPRAGQTIEQLREDMERLAAGKLLAPNITVEAAQAGGVPAEWVVAPRAERSRVLLYFHGGGFYRGSVRTVREMVSRISAASGWAVLSVDYRLAPENPFPAALDDAIAAADWLTGQGGVSTWAVGGDSCGGGLALSLLLHRRDGGLSLPSGAVTLSPWVDLTQSGASYTERADVDPNMTREYLDKFAAMYLGEADPRGPLASPLFADLTGLPPLLIQVGTSEVLLDDSRQFARKALAAGVQVKLEEWQEMIHVWQNLGPTLPEAVSATAQIGQYLRHLTGN